MTTKRMKHLKDMLIRARANASESLTDMPEALRALGIEGGTCESACAVNERRTVVEVIVHAHNRIEKIDAALQRISDGSYGICVECEEEIREGRLLVTPWAERCILCQEHREAAMVNQMPNDFKHMIGKPLEAVWRA